MRFIHLGNDAPASDSGFGLRRRNSAAARARRLGPWLSAGLLLLALQTPLVSAQPIILPAVPPAVAAPSVAPALAPAATTTPTIHVAFRKSSVVRGADYTLGDVAVVSTADPAEARRLSALTMGRSPALGVALPLNERQLAMVLERLGIAADAGVEYPDRMFLQRDVQNLDAQAFRTAVEKAAREQSPLDRDQLLLTDVRVPRLPLLPAGDVTYEFSFRYPSRGAGDVSYQAQVLVDGERQASLTASLHADVLVETIKVQKRIARGEAVGLDSCQVALSPLSEQRIRALQSADLEKPLVAKRDLAAGEVLTASAVTKQVLVTRGQPVRMLLDNNGIRIAAQGVARANGSKGDTIEVTNSSSGAKVQAVVMDRQTVSVSF